MLKVSTCCRQAEIKIDPMTRHTQILCHAHHCRKTTATDRTHVHRRQASRRGSSASADRRWRWRSLRRKGPETQAMGKKRKEQRLNVYSTVTYTPKNCTPICCRFLLLLLLLLSVWPRSVHHIERSYSFTICSLSICCAQTQKPRTPDSRDPRHILFWSTYSRALPKFALFQGKHMLWFFDSCGFFVVALSR